MRTRAIGSLLREVMCLARTQWAFGIVTLLLVAASTLTVVTTAGRSAAAQASVLATIDAEGTRTIVVRAKGTQPGVDEHLVAALARADDVEAVTALGPVTDATAAANPAGTRLGIRAAYGSIGGVALRQPAPGPLGPQAWASIASARTAGIAPGAGTLRMLDGPEVTVTRTLEVPPYLAELEPLTLLPAVDPRPGQPPRPVFAIYVLVRSPEAVEVVTRLVGRMLADVPSDGVTIETSAALADLRAAVGGELTRQSRGLVLGVLAAAAATSVLNVLGYTMMRRKDFGRRRALGATRLVIVLLIALHVLLVAALGAVVGTAIGYAWLARSAGPLPPWQFTVAVGCAVVALSTLAAAAPAAVAARRDPVQELRVP